MDEQPGVTVHPRTGRPVTAADFSPRAGSEQLPDRRRDPECERQVAKRRPVTQPQHA